MEQRKQSHVIAGVGSPVVDQVARVPYSFVEEIGGEKGGMELVDKEAFAALLASLPQSPMSTPGGSAGNTTFALARMGIASRFLGVIGNDTAGAYYRDAFVLAGGSPSCFRLREDMPTAQCLSLVTPDGERTMRTHLGAALSLAADDIRPADFSGCDHVHIEGYLLFNEELLQHVLETVKEAGCTTSIDLASFEVVGAARQRLPRLLTDYIDMVFANEEEAEAYAGTSDPEECLAQLSACCGLAAVKYGSEGAVIRNGGRSCRVQARRVDRVVDTTGAGDMWAAGFLYGMGCGLDLDRCGLFGSMLGAAVVRHEGAAIPEHEWDLLLAEIEGPELVEERL